MAEKVKNFVIGQRYKSRLGLVECIHINSAGSPIGEFIDNNENGWGSPEEALKEYSYKSKYTGKFYGLFEHDDWTLAVEEPKSKSEPKFKVGDRVRSRQPGYKYTGTIISFNEDNSECVIKTDNTCLGRWDCSVLPDGNITTARGCWDSKSYLELVEEPKSKSEPKFKVGDRVKYINKEKEGYNISFWELGGYGTVTDLGQEQGGTKCFDSEKNVYVTIDQEYTERESTRDSVVSKNNLELVEDEPILDEPITATEFRYGTVTVGTNTYSYDKPISPWKVIYGMGMDKINSNAQQEQPNNNMNNGLISKMKDLLMSEPKKTLLKYNIIDREENLTNEGKELFINFMFEQNKDKFIDEVVSVFVKAEEKESKKK